MLVSSVLDILIFVALGGVTKMIKDIATHAFRTCKASNRG